MLYITQICLCVCSGPVLVRGVQLTQEDFSGGICATGISARCDSNGRSVNPDLYMVDMRRLPPAIANPCQARIKCLHELLYVTSHLVHGGY